MNKNKNKLVTINWAITYVLHNHCLDANKFDSNDFFGKMTQ